MPAIIDSNSGSNNFDTLIGSGTFNAVSQSFIINSGPVAITTITLGLYKSGTPPGNFNLSLYRAIVNSDGSLAQGAQLYTTPISASVLSTSPTSNPNFNFAGAGLLIPNGQYFIGIEYSGGTFGNNLNWRNEGANIPGKYSYTTSVGGTVASQSTDYAYAILGDYLNYKTQGGVFRVQAVPAAFPTNTIVGGYGSSVWGMQSAGEVSRALNITTTKTQSGIFRVFAVTTKTQSGVFRTQAIASRTQTGKFRTTGILTRTQTGIFRTQGTLDRTQTGKFRVQATTDRAQTGVFRVAVTTDQTQTGLFRVANEPSQNQPGIFRVQGTLDRTQSGKFNVVQLTTQSQTGKFRVYAVTTKNQTGIFRVRADITRNQTGVFRVYKLTTQAQTGQFRVSLTNDKTQTGKFNVMATVDRTQSGTFRVTIINNQTQTGRFRVAAVVTQTQTGKFAVFKLSDKEQGGVFRTYNKYIGGGIYNPDYQPTGEFDPTSIGEGTLYVPDFANGGNFEANEAQEGTYTNTLISKGTF